MWLLTWLGGGLTPGGRLRCQGLSRGMCVIDLVGWGTDARWGWALSGLICGYCLFDLVGRGGGREEGVAIMCGINWEKLGFPTCT